MHYELGVILARKWCSFAKNHIHAEIAELYGRLRGVVRRGVGSMETEQRRVVLPDRAFDGGGQWAEE
jgi:hypothetical protein